MRVLTTIIVAFAEQNDDPESAINSVDNSSEAVESPIELVSIYQGRNRVIPVDWSED